MRSSGFSYLTPRPARCSRCPVCGVLPPHRGSSSLKVLAHRVGEDEDDVRLLAGALGISTAADVLAIVEEVFGDRLDAAARFFVEELFAPE